ncbi:hypothetical protein [Rhizorhabdus dicambivorans]|uniref:hypothetical protein n=1 Tax=Rhizorhabdus dicambivorans TaxID=1850238 RepID=UPI002F264DCC
MDPITYLVGGIPDNEMNLIARIGQAPAFPLEYPVVDRLMMRTEMSDAAFHHPQLQLLV